MHVTMTEERMGGERGVGYMGADGGQKETGMVGNWWIYFSVEQKQPLS